MSPIYYECEMIPSCGQCFAHAISEKNHRTQHSHITLCAFGCGEKFVTAQARRLHEQTHSPKYTCDLCPEWEGVVHRESLSRHKRERHPALFCPGRKHGCTKTYLQEGRLRSHVTKCPVVQNIGSSAIPGTLSTQNLDPPSSPPVERHDLAITLSQIFQSFGANTTTPLIAVESQMLSQPSTSNITSFPPISVDDSGRYEVYPPYPSHPMSPAQADVGSPTHFDPGSYNNHRHFTSSYHS